MNKLELPSNIRLKLTTPYDLGLIAADIMQNYSHDPKKQTGAAIIDTEYNIYGLGSNTYPYKKELTEADKEDCRRSICGRKAYSFRKPLQARLYRRIPSQI